MRLIAMILGLPATLAAATVHVTTTAPSAQQGATFKSSLVTVNVFATVRTRDRKIVRDLDRHDFELRVDGKPREITVFSKEAQPVTVAMLLDSSGSIETVHRDQMSVAARAFIGFMSPGDRLSLGTLFYDCVPFTDNRATLLGQLREDEDLKQAIAFNGREAVDAAFARDPRGRAFGSLSRYESQWPINYVQAGMPPYLFLIAESEQVNPAVLQTNQQFVADARAKGNQADFKVFPGRTHYSMIREIQQPGDIVFAAVTDFVRR